MDSEQAVQAMLMMGGHHPSTSGKCGSFQHRGFLPLPWHNTCYTICNVAYLGRRQIPLGAETPRNIHEDLEVSESDEEGADAGSNKGSGDDGGGLSEDDFADEESSPMKHFNQPQDQQPPDDDGIWF
jgi:hypothetical protein